MPLPEMRSGLLPPCVFPHPHRGSLHEVRNLFVDQAPFSDERRVLFRTLELYAELVWAEIADAKLWIDGGFVTHKPWAAPADADVVIVVPEATVPRVDAARLAPLITHQNMSTGSLSGPHGKPFRLARMQPMGGKIDGFVTVESDVDDMAEGTASYWFDLWSRVTDRHKEPVTNLRKGFVEVVNPDA